MRHHFEASVLWTDAFNSAAANNLSDLEWFLLLWPDRIRSTANNFDDYSDCI